MPGSTPGSACSRQTPRTGCSGTATHRCCNPAACRYSACARRQSGSPSPPAHPASAENSRSTSVADNSPRSAATARSLHPTARSRPSYRTASAPKAAPTAPWRCLQKPSLPAAHIPSPSPPGSESNPRAVAARCPPATTPPSPPDPSPPVDYARPRTVQTAPARSPPALPVQLIPCSCHSPEHKINRKLAGGKPGAPARPRPTLTGETPVAPPSDSSRRRIQHLVLRRRHLFHQIQIARKHLIHLRRLPLGLALSHIQQLTKHTRINPQLTRQRSRRFPPPSHH